MQTVNIKPHNVRVPIFVPARITKEQSISALDLDSRFKFIYSGLCLADTIDGFIVELENDTIKAGLYRQKLKSSINEMKKRMNNFKNLMLHPNCIPPGFEKKIGRKLEPKERKELIDNYRQSLADELDTLEDSFRKDMMILFYSIKRYISKFVPDSLHVTCLARVSVIDILSSYSLLSDKNLSEIISKASGKNVNLEDSNMRQVYFLSTVYIKEIFDRYKYIHLDLNNCDEIFTAFSIIDKKMNRIHELLK